MAAWMYSIYKEDELREFETFLQCVTVRQVTRHASKSKKKKKTPFHHGFEYKKRTALVQYSTRTGGYRYVHTGTEAYFRALFTSQKGRAFSSSRSRIEIALCIIIINVRGSLFFFFLRSFFVSAHTCLALKPAPRKQSARRTTAFTHRACEHVQGGF